MTTLFGILHAVSPLGDFSQHTPVGNLPEVLGAGLSAHIQYPAKELLMTAEGQPDQGRGEITLTIHCLGCGIKWMRGYLTELESVAAIIGFHGGHEGHHLAFRVNQRDWLVPCQCQEHQMEEGREN